MDKNIEKFNTILIDLSKELNNLYPKNFKLLIIKNLKNNINYIDFFIEKISNKMKLIENKDLVLFKNEIIKDYNLEDLILLKLSDITKKNLWKYINILFIYGFNYKKDKTLKQLLLETQNDKDEQSKLFTNIIKNLNKEKGDDKGTGDKEDDDKGDDDKGDDDKGDDDKGDSETNFNNIFQGEIGKLASDIASDIDLSKIDTSNPSELLNSLMSGNINNNDNIMNLFKDVTTKIQKKIADGSINCDKLTKEANNLMGSVDKNGINNQMNMFQNLMGSDKNGKNNQMNMFQNLFNMSDMMPKKANLKISIKSNSTRDRLRKKLENRKKQNLIKQNLIKQNLIKKNNIQNNIIQNNIIENNKINIENEIKNKKNILKNKIAEYNQKKQQTKNKGKKWDFDVL